MKADFPIDEMLAAARAAPSHELALWAALKVLDQHDGYIMLPGEFGCGWCPKLKPLQRRAQARAARKARKASVERKP